MDEVTAHPSDELPTDGLMAMADDLARTVESLRREIVNGDAPMAAGYASHARTSAATLAAAVWEWHRGIPAMPDPKVNPHGPVPLVGRSVTEAVERLTPDELVELRSELAWEREREHRPPAHDWLTRALRTIEAEIAGRES